MLYNIFMKVFTQLNENKNLVLILGFFDGFHLGHQKVITSAVNYAKLNGLKTAILTFKKHPLCVIKNIKPKYIMQNRQDFVQNFGIDYFYELDFDLNIANMDPQDYLNNILVKYFEPNAIFTGFNHTFGIDKKGTPALLEISKDKYGYKYFQISPQMLDGEVISSTKIRNALSNGDLQLVNSMLGRNFTLSSIVVEGEKIGRTIGFKTANVIYPDEIVRIPFGVYEVNTNYGKGIANFGIRPTVNNIEEPILEVHILNFEEDIYGETLTIEFVKTIRKEQKFESLDKLKEQIKKDISTINF